MKKSYSILIADDNTDYRDTVKDSIEYSKYKKCDVTCCGSVSEVMGHFNKGKFFDIAVIDLGIGSEGRGSWLPDSGAELARRLQEIGTKVGFLLVQKSGVSDKIADELHVPFFSKLKTFGPKGFERIVDQILTFGDQEQISISREKER